MQGIFMGRAFDAVMMLLLRRTLVRQNISWQERTAASNLC